MSKTKRKKNGLYITELIPLIIPEHATEYRSAMNTATDSEPLYVCNFNNVREWRRRVTKDLENYLTNNHLEQFITDERITFFMNYIWGIRLRCTYSKEYLTKYSTENTPFTSGELYSRFFIRKCLNRYKKMNSQSKRDKMVISANDMAIFFCLSLDIDTCFKDTIYKLSANQRNQINRLYTQTIKFKESAKAPLEDLFLEFIKIFFHD